MVYAAGPITTELVATELSDAERTKPIFGGFPELSERADLPLTADGASGIPNFTYASTSNRVVADLSMLVKLTGEKQIYVVLDAGIYDLFREDRAEISAVEEHIGAEVFFYPATRFAKEPLAAIPEDARAVYVAFLPRFSLSELRRLFGRLTERKAFSMSMFGRSVLNFGATAALAADLRDPVARRSALNLHLLFLGRRTDELVVHLPNEDKLIINTPVANAIGWAPDYETHLTAEFTGEPLDSARARTLTLAEAMNRAAEENADVLVNTHAVEVAKADERITVARARPFVELNAVHQGLHRNDAINPLSADREHSGSYGIRLQQVLFDDELWSAIRAQGHATRAAEHDQRSAQLDARASAGVGYLQWVLSEVLYQIEKDNLELTEDNLRLAKLRVEIGTAEPTEIYRWESEVAGDRALLFQRESERHNALVSLNRIMGEERAKRWRPKEIEVTESDVVFMNDVLAPLIQKGAWFENLAHFFETIAVENSPELSSFDEALEAEGILLKQKRRAYYTPSLSAEAGYDRAVAGTEGLKADGENQWTVSLGMNLPLFEGGRRKADIDRQRSLIEQIGEQRRGVVETLEEQARVAFNTMAADHANIRLNRAAYASAHKNYEAVSAKYSQGRATILDLLDAQSRLLTQRQLVASANYGYLIDVVSLQRAIAWFEGTASDEDRNRFGERVKQEMGAAFHESKAHKTAEQKDSK